MNAHLSERAHAPCLVLGAGGRVGRLLRGAWSGATDRAPVLFHSRKPEAGIDIVAPFGAKLAARVKGPVSAVLVLSGATSGSEQDLSANSRRALVGLEIAKALKVSQVILCSSAAVYRASPDHPPFDEGATAETVTDRLYGQAKLAMEAAAMDWVRQFGGELEVTCLRMANVIGADQLARAVRRASLDAPLRLDRFADGAAPGEAICPPRHLPGWWWP